MVTVNVRKYSETMRDQGKSSLEEMRRFVCAWVGATDLAYGRMLTELKDRVQVGKLQKQAKKLNREEVGRQVRETYDDLAERGEEVIQQVRTRPPARRLVFKRTERALKQAEHKVEDAEHRVTGAPAGINDVAHKASANNR